MSPARPEGASASENIKLIAGWLGLTAAGVAAIFAAARPEACVSNKECATIFAGGIQDINRYAVIAMTVGALLQFMTTLILYFKTRGMVGIVKDIEYTFIPPMLLCIALLMLLAENLMLYRGAFVHVAAEGVGKHHRPIYSPILLEWLVNVPILLILSGYSALNRPLAEVSRPLVVTNIYMIMAWSAYFIPNEPLRWLVIAFAFLMFAWASYDMANWVFMFRATARPGIPSRTLRCVLTIGLILDFFVYGMVYLAGIMDLLSPREELLCLVAGNIGTKLFFVIAFVGIRASQFYDLLVTLVKLKVLPLDMLMPHDLEALEGGADEPLVD